jgi:hypothetical protein
VLCGTYALNWRPKEIPAVTPGSAADWEAA